MTQDKVSKKKRRRNRHKQQEDRGGQGDELLVNGVIPGVPMATGDGSASLNDDRDDGRLSSDAQAEDKQIEQRGNTPEDETSHDEPTGNLRENLEHGKSEEEREEDQMNEQGEHHRDEVEEETEDGEELLGYLEGEAIEENYGM